MTTLSESDPQLTQQPAKRAQFPLWFLLFVIPTIAGLAFAIYSNWQQQTHVRAELVAHQAILRDEIATIQSEIDLVRHLDQRMQIEADRWKSAELVVNALKVHSEEKLITEPVFLEVRVWHVGHLYLVQANEEDLHQLLAEIRDAYSQYSISNRFSLLKFTEDIPAYAPQHVGALAEDVQLLVDLIGADDDPHLIAQGNRVREAFHLAELSEAEEGAK